MNRASSATGWVRNPVMKSPELDPTQASSYELGWTTNPITGCLNGCEYCYARKLANTRLRERYLANTNIAPISKVQGERMYRLANERGIVLRENALTDPFYPRFWEDRLNDAIRGYHRADFVDGNVPFAAAPRGVFVCDMSDLFGIGIPKEWTGRVLAKIKDWDNRFDRFYLLTKQPQNLIKFSPFPDNCWVGVSVTNKEQMSKLYHLCYIEANKKFVSFEPLLERINPLTYTVTIPWAGGYANGGRNYSPLINHIDWVIIGAQTKPYKLPKIEWVEEIVEAYDKAGIPIFLKDNLLPIMPPNTLFSPFHFGIYGIRQEVPKC